MHPIKEYNLPLDTQENNEPIHRWAIKDGLCTHGSTIVPLM